MTEIKFLLKFGKREHLESLVKGNIYCSNAITFWGIEDKLKIKGQGDILEAGTRMFAQKMIMHNPDTKRNNCRIWEFKRFNESRTSRKNASILYVCCL